MENKIIKICKKITLCCGYINLAIGIMNSTAAYITEASGQFYFGIAWIIFGGVLITLGTK